MKLQTTLLLILVLGCFTTSIFAQTENVSQEQAELTTLHPYVKMHGFSTELFGSMTLAAFNYERPILKRSNYFVNAKIGAGSFIGPMFPHSLSLNIGQKHHYFELGYQGTVGWMLDIFEDEGWMFGYMPSPIVGYRYYFSKGFFKIYASGFYNPYLQPKFFPWGGVGFGHYFKSKKQK